jgi:hypothetical protein
MKRNPTNIGAYINYVHARLDESMYRRHRFGLVPDTD